MKRATISYEYGTRTVEQPLVPPEMRVGRSPEMDIVVSANVAGVSRHHATLRHVDDTWIIEDAGSRNGTYVNQQRADKTRLRDGDRIHLGPFRLVFQEVEDQFPVSEPAHARTAEISTPIAPPLSLSRSPSWMGRLSCSINVAGLSPASAPQEEAASGPDQLPPVGQEMVAEELEPERAQSIKFFSNICRALLVSDSVDEMLENVMIEVFRQVPAERGMIGLIDAATGDIVPKVVRSSAGNDPIQISRTITAAAVSSKSALLVEDTSVDKRFLHIASINELRIRSAMCVPLYCDGQVHGVIYADSQNVDHPFDRNHLEVFTALALFSAVGIQQALLRDQAMHEQKKRERLARYASPAVIDRVIAVQDADAAAMLADLVEVSVLFADMKGFTALAERKSPSEVVQVLNSVFSLLTRSVFEQHGTLDKFMGDGMLAFFGAPLAQPDHAECAVRAAVQMQRILEEFNTLLPEDERIGLRIGVNTGMAIVGDIGSLERKDYTVIGDTVNVASRFESSVANVGEIIIGETTYRAMGGAFPCEALEPVLLKGKHQPVTAYRLAWRSQLK